jgi:peptide/nickel transport system substrate-binding protein
MKDGARGREVLAAMIVAAIAMVSSTVVGVETSDNAAAEDDVVLKIGFPHVLDSLNPNVGMTRPSDSFYSLVYDGLFRIDEDLNVAGNLAVDWRVDSDFEPYGSVWLYNLTSDAMWHDGMPFTADDVVFTMNLHADNYYQMWSHQPYAYYLDYAEKVGEHALRIHYYDRSTEAPTPVAFGDALLMPILPEHMLEGYTAAEISFDWDGLFEEGDCPIVGTGPFVATSSIHDEYISGEAITLVRNPDYHRGSSNDLDIRYDGLEIHRFSDYMNMTIALIDGVIDVARYDGPRFGSYVEVLQGNLTEDLDIINVPNCAQHIKVLDFDLRPIFGNPIRLDPAVRQAMAMAINKSEVVESPDMLDGYATEGCTLIPSSNPDWHCELTSDELFKHDVEAANAALEAAGYEFTAESPERRVATASSWAVQQGLVPEGTKLIFDLAYRRDSPEQEEIADYVKEEWGKIGIDIVPRTSMLAPLCPEYYFYEIMIWDFWGRTPDPQEALFTQSRAAWNGWNDNYYFNPEYDSLYNESIGEFNEDARKDLAHECQRIHYGDVPYIILAEVNSTYALRNDRFVGWGDWSEKPGMSIDNTWGASPLYFNLEPVGGGSGSTITIVVVVGAIVLVCAVAVLIMARRPQ